MNENYQIQLPYASEMPHSHEPFETLPDESSIMDEHLHEVIVPTWHIRASRNNFLSRIANPVILAVRLENRNLI